jgi:hypothetical protein
MLKSLFYRNSERILYIYFRPDGEQPRKMQSLWPYGSEHCAHWNRDSCPRLRFSQLLPVRSKLPVDLICFCCTKTIIVKSTSEYLNNTIVYSNGGLRQIVCSDPFVVMFSLFLFCFCSLFCYIFCF